MGSGNGIIIGEVGRGKGEKIVSKVWDGRKKFPPSASMFLYCPLLETDLLHISK